MLTSQNESTVNANANEDSEVTENVDNENIDDDDDDDNDEALLYEAVGEDNDDISEDTNIPQVLDNFIPFGLTLTIVFLTLNIFKTSIEN